MNATRRSTSPRLIASMNPITAATGGSGDRTRRSFQTMDMLQPEHADQVRLQWVAARTARRPLRCDQTHATEMSCQKTSDCHLGWRVGVEGFAAVGADGGCCAVGVQGDVPAPSMDGYLVMEPAEQREVGQGVG